MYTLKLGEQQINLILSSLAELPYRVSAPLIDEIRQQAMSKVDDEKAEDNSG